MVEVRQVSLAEIDSNPFRNTGDYPYIERKIKALIASYEDVGMWEGVIGRERGNRVEIAFGHHRVKAAEDAGMTHVPIIIRELDDEQMLRHMGRENMEDYNADFLTMLETWEAAVKWMTSRDVNSPQPIEVTRLLGWTQDRTGGGDQMNRTAEACNAAHRLLIAGHVKREDLVDLNVKSAREILTRAAASIQRIQKTAKKLGTPARQTQQAVKQVAKAVKTTATQARAGAVPQASLRQQVDLNAYKHAQSSKAKSNPLFAQFGKVLADDLSKLLKADTKAQKLAEVVKALPVVQNEDDKQIVRRLAFELDELETRVGKFKTAMVLPAHKVTPLKAVEGGSE